MRELPILFSAPMVRAIIEGRKTVTRRVVKPQPVEALYLTHSGFSAWHNEKGQPLRNRYGQPGDRLWVRETFTLESCVDGNEPPHNDTRPVKVRPDDDWDGSYPAWTQPHYRATDVAPDLCCESATCAQCREHDMGPHWRPSIHMPRWASRITLEVTGVRVERLNEISAESAVAEGLRTFPHKGGLAYAWKDDDRHGHGSATGAFRNLWESINGAGSWDANPWVWVVEFKRARP